MITDATVGGKFLLTSDLFVRSWEQIQDFRLETLWDQPIGSLDHPKWFEIANQPFLQQNNWYFLFFISNEQDSVAAIECEQTTVANENNAL